MKKLTAIIFCALVIANMAFAVQTELDVNYYYTFTNNSNFVATSGDARYHDAYNNNYDSIDLGNFRNAKEDALTINREVAGIETILSIFFGKPYSWFEFGLNLGANVAWFSNLTSTDNNNCFVLSTLLTDGNIIINSVGMEWSAMVGPAFRFATVENQYVYFSPTLKSTWLMQSSGSYSLNDFTWFYKWDLGLNLNIGYRLFFSSQTKSKFGLDAGVNLGIPFFGITDTDMSWENSSNVHYYYNIYGRETGGFTGNIYVGVCFNFGKN